jgi:hypothetical protein
MDAHWPARPAAGQLLPAPPELSVAKVNGGAKRTEANGNGQLDALWAQLPEQVKAGLVAMAVYPPLVLPAQRTANCCRRRRNFGLWQRSTGTGVKRI